jgi:hypothetical protein
LKNKIKDNFVLNSQARNGSFDMVFEEKILRPLGVRSWISMVFLFFSYIFFPSADRSGSNEWLCCFDFSNMIYIFSMELQSSTSMR